MFTGLVEEVGEILSIEKGQAYCRITIKANTVLRETHIGDSICTNGVCLTVKQIGQGTFTADLMPETLNRSTFASAKKGQLVNLERALRLGDRLGGHLVSGHIDGTGNIVGIERQGDAWVYEVSTSVHLLKYMIEKGSVAMDGISLTLVSADFETFQVSTIPHTRMSTRLDSTKIGDAVNLECDFFGKYVERLSQFQHMKGHSTAIIDQNFLEKHGF